MAAANSTILKFSILLIILCAFESREASFLNPPVRVTIINNVVVPPNPTEITVHCKSKDDDLGFHTLKFGDRYSFSFNPNFIGGGTLFFCSFTWPENPHRHYLDIYDEDHDGCNDCTWLINLKGGCLNSHKCGTWKSIQ
jgi:hypothetical protein